MVRDEIDPEQLAGGTERDGRSAFRVVRQIALQRHTEQRGPCPGGEFDMLPAEQIGEDRAARIDGQVGADAVRDAEHRAQIAPAQIGLEDLPVRQLQQRAILGDDAAVDHRPAGLELAAADIDDAGLLGPLAMRAVGNDADDVDPARQRHVVEFVAALDRRILPAAQHVVDVELDIVADRQLAAQADMLEDVGILRLPGREGRAIAGEAARPERQGRRVDVADGGISGMERPEQIAVGRAAFEADARGGGMAAIVAGEVAGEAGLEQIGRDPRFVMVDQPAAGAVALRTDREIECRIAGPAIGRLDLQCLLGRGRHLGQPVEPLLACAARLDRQLLGRGQGQGQVVGIHRDLDRQQRLELRGGDEDVGRRYAGGSRRQGYRAAADHGGAGREIDQQRTPAFADAAGHALLGRHHLDVELEQPGQLADRDQRVLRIAIGRHRLAQCRAIEHDGEQAQAIIAERADDRRRSWRR